MLDKIKDLIKRKDTCVLATVFDQRPHCSLMSYVPDEECRKIYLVTHKQTKKFKNMLQNPVVALLIDTRDEDVGSRRGQAKALTLHGIVQKISGKGEEDAFRDQMLVKHPHLKEFVSHPDAEIFSVKIESCQLLEGPTQSYFERVDE